MIGLFEPVAAAWNVGGIPGGMPLCACLAPPPCATTYSLLCFGMEERGVCWLYCSGGVVCVPLLAVKVVHSGRPNTHTELLKQGCCGALQYNQ